jgi:hypothetical protein
LQGIESFDRMESSGRIESVKKNYSRKKSDTEIDVVTYFKTYLGKYFAIDPVENKTLSYEKQYYNLKASILKLSELEIFIAEIRSSHMQQLRELQELHDKFARHEDEDQDEYDKDEETDIKIQNISTHINFAKPKIYILQHIDYLHDEDIFVNEFNWSTANQKERKKFTDLINTKYIIKNIGEKKNNDISHNPQLNDFMFDTKPMIIKREPLVLTVDVNTNTCHLYGWINTNNLPIPLPDDSGINTIIMRHIHKMKITVNENWHSDKVDIIRVIYIKDKKIDIYDYADLHFQENINHKIIDYCMMLTFDQKRYADIFNVNYGVHHYGNISPIIERSRNGKYKGVNGIATNNYFQIDTHFCMQ